MNENISNKILSTLGVIVAMFIFIVTLITNLVSREDLIDFSNLTKERVEVLDSRIEVMRHRNEFLTDKLEFAKEKCEFFADRGVDEKR